MEQKFGHLAQEANTEVVDGVDDLASERGMATAELLGNAALGIAALVAIWAVLQAVGLDVMEWIRAQLQV